MIRFIDAVVLAQTKLRTHKIRTGLTLGVAGILFGLILAVIFVAQGTFESVDRFDEEGLADRSVVHISKWNNNWYSPYEHAEDEDFVAEVKEAHAAYVTKKTLSAKKYNIPYDPVRDDPIPIEKNKETGRDRVSEDDLGSHIVNEIVAKRTAAAYKPINITEVLAPYSSARILPGNGLVGVTANGEMAQMPGGKEAALIPEKDRRPSRQNSQRQVSVQVLNDAVTDPFMVKRAFDYTKNEIPGVVSYQYAERLLGLEKLPATSSNAEKLDRLREVRSRVGDITSSFCYRNGPSQQRLNEALAQREDADKNVGNKNWVAPSLRYQLPANDSCGAVEVAKDTRTAAEKRQTDNYQAYLKDIGEHPGEPVQYKIVMRAVGLSGDTPYSSEGGQWNAGELVSGLLGSWLGYDDNWSIPVGMLAKVPEHLRPAELFPDASVHESQANLGNGRIQIDSYMVEFTNKDEARDLFGKHKDATFDQVSVMPFGSAALMVDEMKQWFAIGLFWALAVVGGVAFIILAGLIGRMVSDGRRESAVFRAIGARRIDIGRIYGMYTLLLAFRVVLFATVLALVMALAVDVWLSADATTAARLAYAAVDTTKEFHFIGVWTWYVPVILGAIIVVSLLASIIPILLGARRNPITDMRNDT